MNTTDPRALGLALLTPWGSCRLDVDARGRLALAPPPCVCGEVYLPLPTLGDALRLRQRVRPGRRGGLQPLLGVPPQPEPLLLGRAGQPRLARAVEGHRGARGGGRRALPAASAEAPTGRELSTRSDEVISDQSKSHKSKSTLSHMRHARGTGHCALCNTAARAALGVQSVTAHIQGRGAKS